MLFIEYSVESLLFLFVVLFSTKNELLFSSLGFTFNRFLLSKNKLLDASIYNSLFITSNKFKFLFRLFKFFLSFFYYYLTNKYY